MIWAEQGKAKKKKNKKREKEKKMQLTRLKDPQDSCGLGFSFYLAPG